MYSHCTVTFIAIKTPKSDNSQSAVKKLKLNRLTVLILVCALIVTTAIENNYTFNSVITVNVFVTRLVFSLINACIEKRCEFISYRTLEIMNLILNVLFTTVSFQTLSFCNCEDTTELNQPNVSVEQSKYYH